MNRRLGLAIAVVVGVVALVGIGAPWYLEWQRDRRAGRELLVQPVYRALEAHEPDVYQDLVARYASTSDDPAARAEFTRHAYGVIVTVATKHIATASQPAVLGLVRDMVDHMKQLQKRGDDSCFRFIFPQVSGPADPRVFDERSQERTFGLIADVINTSAEHPVRVPQIAAQQNELAPIINSVYDEYGPAVQMMSHPDNPHVDRAKLCAISIALYDKVLALPPDHATAILRIMTQL